MEVLGEERFARADGPTKAAEEPKSKPLTWQLGTFRVLIAENDRCEELHEIEVRGPVSGPFGVFRGDGRGPAPPDRSFFSLVHLPTGRVMASLRLRRECMAMASELLPLRVPWRESDPERVVEGAPDQRRVQEIHARYKALWR